MNLQHVLHRAEPCTARQALQHIRRVQVVDIPSFSLGNARHHISIAVARTDFPVAKRLQTICLDIRRGIFQTHGSPALEQVNGVVFQIIIVKMSIVPFDRINQARCIDALVFFFWQQRCHRLALGIVHLSVMCDYIRHLLNRHAERLHDRVFFHTAGGIDRPCDNARSNDDAKRQNTHARRLFSIDNRQQHKQPRRNIQAIVAKEDNSEQQQCPFDQKRLIAQQVSL